MTIIDILNKPEAIIRLSKKETTIIWYYLVQNPHFAATRNVIFGIGFIYFIYRGVYKKYNFKISFNKKNSLSDFSVTSKKDNSI
jgi:hypothetical protein